MRTLCLLSLTTLAVHADPQLTSWITEYSSKYARIHKTDAERAAGTTTYTTWSNTSGNLSQSLPAYCGVQSITCSSSWIYFNTTNLGPYTMGPWYDNAARTLAFINMPVRQNINFRIPRSSTLAAPPATKTITKGPEDAIGFFVDGVAMYDATDGFTYNNGTESSGGAGGQWNRHAFANEYITFDAGNTHQQNTGKYHNHANPLALRHLLGDHVEMNATTRTYYESSAPPVKHSPILGWLRDGLPIYGPYGYSSAMDASSSIRRMVGGFVLRDGATTGVDNITTAGRTLPAWATRNNGGISSAGPAVSTTYFLGRYCEDWAYLGDLVKTGTTKYQQGTDFDLNEYNVRYCVTPEFPAGTWAYFVNISAAGVPQFPVNTGYYFFGNPTGGTSTASETVTPYFNTGGANLVEAAAAPAVNAASGDVTLTWSSVEGGTYQVEASTNLSSWTVLTSTKAAASNAIDTSHVEAGAENIHAGRFYRVKRMALAAYDTGTTTTPTAQGISSISPAAGSRGAAVTTTITLNSGYSTPPPPATVTPTSVTLTRTGATTITAGTLSRNSTTGVITAAFTLPAGATTGSYTVNATFGPNTWSLANGFTVN